MMPAYQSPVAAAQRKLARMGCELVSMEMVGQDPSEGCVTFVVVAEGVGVMGPDRFSVHIFRDWTISDSASLGYAFGQGYYGFDYDEAVERAINIARDYRRMYAWNDPATGRRLPKGWY